MIVFNKYCTSRLPSCKAHAYSEIRGISLSRYEVHQYRYMLWGWLIGLMDVIAHPFVVTQYFAALPHTSTHVYISFLALKLLL